MGGQDDKEKKKEKYDGKDSKRWARQMGRRIRRERMIRWVRKRYYKRGEHHGWAGELRFAGKRW